jgi:hypothetical protein
VCCGLSPAGTLEVVGVGPKTLYHNSQAADGQWQPEWDQDLDSPEFRMGEVVCARGPMAELELFGIGDLLIPDRTGG